ncbi:MAG: hypothetical protein Aureis2KO_04900 [Aureisphaera sp.]
MDWFDNQSEWKEQHSYDDPKVSSEEMRNWFFEMIQTFPAMNGPYAHDDIDNPKLTDYSTGKDVIYAAFSWSEAENAYPKMLELAKKHKVGFFDVSSNNGNIFFPDSDNGFGKIDNPEKENSFEEIENSEKITKSNNNISWWKRIFNRK